MNCKKCNYILKGNEVFCPNCGNKIDNKNKKMLIIIGILILVLILLVVIIFNYKKNNISSLDYSNTSSDKIISTSYTDNGIPKFIDGKFSNITVKNEEDLFSVLEEIKELLQIENPKKELTLISSEESENITYYRLNQIYNDIEVYNNNIVISIDNKGNVKSLSGYIVPKIEVDIEEEMPIDEIEDIAKKDLGENATIIESKKYILADHNSQNLVYMIIGYSDNKEKEYIIDANSGEIITATDLFDSALYEYTGKGMNDATHTISLDKYYNINTLRNEYRFLDEERKIHIYDYKYIGPFLSIAASTLNAVGNEISVYIDDGKINNYDKDLVLAAVTSMKHYEDIYDYYKNVLNRNSYDNKGSAIRINLGVTEKTFSNKDLYNAFWFKNTNQMYIGKYDGVYLSIGKDILAHEFTHGVVQYTSRFASSPTKDNKNRAFETGSLNEAYADILGSLIEGKDWVVASEFDQGRDLTNPLSQSSPNKKGGDFYYPDYYLQNTSLEEYLNKRNYTSLYDYDKGGVHQNATVVGHAAYLMYNNGAFSSKEEMAKIWYNSLFLLSSYSDFEDCALAVIKTAKNFNLSTKSIKIIEDAFIETNMLEDKRVELRGFVYSGEEKIEDVTIELYDTNGNKLDNNIVTDSSGNFAKKIDTGIYELKFIKNGFEKYTTTITIHGDVEINIELAYIEKDSSSDKTKCNKNNCHLLKFYYVDPNDNFKEKYESYEIENGKHLDVKVIINQINLELGGNYVTSDGVNFKYNIEGMKFDVSFYYKGTSKKFDFNKPIYEDTEVEFELFEALKGLSNIFN